MDTKTLFQLSADMAAIEDALWENGGELTEELSLALQETEKTLATKADSYNYLLRSFASKADILDAEIKRLTQLKKTAENAEKRIKEHICETMGMFGMDKIEGNLCKISRARSTKVETNDDQLKAAYLINLEEFNKNLPPYLSAELKVSKTAIKDMQKNDGVLPAGAEIVENYSIRIR
jgi:hypothetical protein